MDPFTLALATFGVQKLRGKSTKRSLRDALVIGGMGQLGGMAGVGGLQAFGQTGANTLACLLYTSPSPRDRTRSRMPSSA